jgi:hydrogenase maturation protein HypF
LETYHIHINGVVQGVGFRPMVYLLAKEMQLNGHIKNGSDGVHIFFNASDQNAILFFDRIKEEAPKQSRIISSEINKSEKIHFHDFSILVDEPDDFSKKVLLSPDASVCQYCRNELRDINNRRYRYPFITCTQCGPRYSIINKLPYERHWTSMQPFEMCEDCKREYNSIADRRFFSQTNSCAACGIKLSIYENANSSLGGDSETILLSIKQYLGQGKIIALKGIGGYLYYAMRIMLHQLNYFASANIGLQNHSQFYTQILKA